LDDLKASIKERLEKSLAARLRELKLNKILEKIMESSPVIFPDSMVQAEVQERLNGLARRFDTDVRGVLNMMAETGNDLGVIEKNWRETAIKSLHARFIVETLVKEQRIEASDADVEQELAQAAAETGRPLEEVKQQYAEGKLMDYVRESIREKRLFDLLLAENKINLGSRVNFVDVMGNNG
jgi:trigger factor